MRNLLVWANGLTTHVIRCEHCTRALKVGAPKMNLKNPRTLLCDDGKHAARGLAREIARELKVPA